MDRRTVANLNFGEGQFYALQVATLIPSAPPWATVIGNAYRLSASPSAPSFISTSLVFQYSGREVPAGEENFLRVYYYAGTVWIPLPTQLDAYHNVAAAPSRGVGLYALMSSVEVPLTLFGWNLMAYPIQATRSVTTALLSISGTYKVVYGYSAPNTWQLYAPNVPTYVVTLNTLNFGHGYWISVTQPITLLLRGAEQTTSRADEVTNLTAPPATYYGEVQASHGFAPTAGLSVVARVNPSAGSGQAVVCGQGQTQLYAGQVVYVVQVWADSASAAGCGATGRVVTFEVGGQVMAASVAWSNTEVWQLPLVPASSVTRSLYLPLVVR